MNTRKTNEMVYRQLLEMYPNAKCALNYSNEYELIVAVILSAQCKDERVNAITPKLFGKYPNFQALASAAQCDVEAIIHPCGMYVNKAKNIIAMSNVVCIKFSGKLPSEYGDLLSLPGVGRKTANVIRIEWFNLPAMPVDTHVFRTSNRLGISNTQNVLECEKQLCKAFLEKDWKKLHHCLISFGRNVCLSQNPKCSHCPFVANCKRKPTKNNNKKPM